jgi:outer membrane protein TolC
MFFAMRPFRLFRAGAVGLALSLAGCATYHPLPPPDSSNLKPGLAQLDLAVPSDKPGAAPKKINPQKPLTPDEVGMIAVLNSPDLASQPGQLDAAQADLLSATLLPNPSISLGYAFLISGLGTSDSLAASISQDIRSIVTYSSRVKAAKTRLKQVSANLLWQEWQVAQKGRLLAVDIYAAQRELDVRNKELALLDKEVAQVRTAMAAGNLDLTAEAPLLAAEASAESSIATARMTLLKDWQDLDALIGLEPSVRFTVARPEPVKLPDNIDPLIQSLSERRPDLVALQLGYEASQLDVRKAIIRQFPTFSLGLSGGWDTSRVYSAGPVVNMDLPIFNRNQGEIASTSATRLQLRAEYQARLDEAEGTSRALVARAQTIKADLEKARVASREASSRLDAALHAYKQGNLGQRDLTDYQTTALERQLDALGYQRTLDETALALSIELGSGFPKTILVSPDKVKRP